MVGFGLGGEDIKQCCPNSLSLKEHMTAYGNMENGSQLWGLGQSDTLGLLSRAASVRRSQGPDIASPARPHPQRHLNSWAHPPPPWIAGASPMLLHPSPRGPQTADTKSARGHTGPPAQAAPQGLGPLPPTPGRRGSALAPPDNRHGRARGSPKSSEASGQSREEPRPTGSTGPGRAGRRLSRSKGGGGPLHLPHLQGPGAGVGVGGSGRWQHHQPRWAHWPQRRAEPSWFLREARPHRPALTRGEWACAGLGWAGRGTHRCSQVASRETGTPERSQRL